MTKQNEIGVTKKKLYMWIGANVFVLLGALIYVVRFMTMVETKLANIDQELNWIWSMK